MCAPGEHHLAVLAGWDSRLAWLMAAVLAAYAGIAAAVAGARPAGAPGKRSAVLGAVVSLGLAMSAQPISHMFVVGHWTADPAAPVWLVAVVSCIPPLVLGHLLHLAATPVPRPGQSRPAVPATPVETPAPTPPQAVAPVRVLPGPASIPVSVPVVLRPRPARPARPVVVPQPTTVRDTQDERLLTTAEFAALCGVAPDTVRKWISRPPVRITPAGRDARLGYLFRADQRPEPAAASHN